MSLSDSLHPKALLPEALRTRATALNRRACDEHGACVLYWMRAAMRAHDNPALDAAIELANVLGVPVLVYQALSERYPYASDRHHRFILEGARDVQAECAARAIPYAFHLERRGHRGDHLLDLAGRAAAVVTESFPWTPIRTWTRRVAEAAPVGMIGMDAACLVPMRTVPADARDRAFRFRSATAAQRRAALETTAADPDPQITAPLPALPFEPVELADADLAELVAACEIDHLVGPVAHTPGGSRAAYARWQAFRDGPLRTYDARRNDPLAGGVSRMSPYLHYGQVSPFRIAREAHGLGGRGAEKFLDELLVWREMSWAWCFHQQDHESLAALPAWARETLEEHAKDPRSEVLDAERLSRARSDDALWDAAQRSLLIHGELHNNLRMTWGKMLPLWSADPATALTRLIDLNHRYALDGRDPNSYGGLLWCLGGFDRPFDPPRPVLGRVRPRDTATHARRLDVAAYAARTAAPARPSPPRTAVIGAGLAGLVLGRTLDDHGWPVTLFDKGRQPGGRLATRRSRQDPNAVFDHGAASFRCTDPRLERHIEAWCERGLLSPWPDAGRLTATEGAASLAAHLATDLEVHCARRIVRLEREAQGWWLIDAEAQREGPFEALALNLPPAQAADLLRTLPASMRGQTALDELISKLDAVQMAPRWMALVRLSDAAPDAASEFAVRAWPSGDVASVVREAARPGTGRTGCFTFEASAAFSTLHLEADAETVAKLLAPRITELLATEVAATAIQCHRWRYALPPDRNSEVQAWHENLGLSLCGDWLGPAGHQGMERAFLSGAASAGRLLGSALVGPVIEAATPAAAQTELFGAAP